MVLNEEMRTVDHCWMKRMDGDGGVLLNYYNQCSAYFHSRTDY